MKPFFDFHTHTFLKTHLNKEKIEEAATPFLEMDVKIPLDIDEWGFNDIVDSQASFSQIALGGGHLIIVALYPLEHAYTKSTFVKLLKKLTPDLNRQLLKNIEEQKISYWDLLLRELSHALKYESESQRVVDGAGNGSDFKYKIINSMAEYDPASPNTIHVVLSVEGGHAFYDNPAILSQDIEAIKERIAEFKTPTAQRPRLFHVNLAHHAQNRFTNHAHAIPIDCAGKGGTDRLGGYNPTEHGLTAEGKEFIRRCLQQENGEKRILIDLKHLSLKARQDYYQLVKDEFPDTPLIATHMGVTGFSSKSFHYVKEGELTPIVRGITEYSDNRCYKVHYEQLFAFELNRDRVCFNPWSINLYDEEIVKIVESGPTGGLIGLVMDERILGKTKSITNYHAPELFSKVRRGMPALLDAPACVNGHLQQVGLDDDILEINTDPRNAHPNGLYYFLNNWLHIIKIGGDKAWKSVCVGSDYDGLINALDVAPKANFMTSFRNRLTQELPLVAGLKEVQLPASAEDLVGALLFDNACDFLKKNWL